MSAISGEAGTMTSIATMMTKPCSSCGLIAAQAGLEYANGSVADNSNGAWLHHVVLITGGAGHVDGTCPGMGVGMIGERTFSSGNERTPTAFGDILTNKVKSAFPLAPGDVFSAQLELMNLNTVVKNVYLTIDFEYVPGGLPKGFKRARAMWLDVTNCGISSVNPPRGKMNFKLSSKKWTVGYQGETLGVGKFFLSPYTCNSNLTRSRWSLARWWQRFEHLQEPAGYVRLPRQLRLWWRSRTRSSYD
jgi:hypothetical protein